MSDRPNVLFIMTDQQRADTIHALGNSAIHTPNFDRLVRRGAAFDNGYSPCPVCVPARYNIRTGCEPPATRYFGNGLHRPRADQPAGMEDRCGPYLPRRMGQLGYRTFGIGKFHTDPRFENLGYDTHLHSEELFDSQESVDGDAYASWLRRERPQYDHIEQIHGERTEMYYQPQASPLTDRDTVESWAADRAIEQLAIDDPRPFFGFVSFVGPHPPLAPPVPYNRMYDPDKMPSPVRGDPAVDHMDEQIPWMNYLIWADDINDAQARILWSRYYGELTYIDWCLGRILDAVEARPDADNTVICFFADHGDHMGDHAGWQKESFFDVSARVPFLVSWPAKITGGQRRGELASLVDLFGIATKAAGTPEMRDGIDILGVLDGSSLPRETLFGCYGVPGGLDFKIMVRSGDWKYIYMANGGGEQLFNLAEDPAEVQQRIGRDPGVGSDLRARAVAYCRDRGMDDALDPGGDLLAFEKTSKPRSRIKQFDASRGVRDFPDDVGKALDAWHAAQG